MKRNWFKGKTKGKQILEGKTELKYEKGNWKEYSQKRGIEGREEK